MSESASGGGHDHVTYASVSLIGARLCQGCGAYVAGDRMDEHQDFHDRLARVEAHLIRE